VTSAASRLGLELGLVMPATLPHNAAPWRLAMAALPVEVSEVRATLGNNSSRTTISDRYLMAKGAAAVLERKRELVVDLPRDGAWDNDVAFGIRRVTGSNPAEADDVYGPLFTTLERFYADALDGGSSLRTDEWDDLERALACCVAFPLMPSSTWSVGTFSHPGAGTQASVDAERRWVIGHHIFMLISEFMVIAANFLATASPEDDRDTKSNALSALVALLRGASAAFRYACDFGTDAYNEVIRPSLAPPVAPEGMSGLNWRDHVHLMSTLKRVRGHFPAHGDELDGTRSELRAAYEGMYLAHTHVCQHFVGSEEPSLSLSAKTRSAVDALDRLKRGRSTLHGITTTD
jgi:hypothetical protein